MTGRFQNHVVLVTGGTGGLGRAVALAFLEEGARVVVTYRRQSEFDDLKNAAAGRAQALEGRVVDATDTAAMQQLVDGILSTHKQLDAVVNAVGGYSGGTNLTELDPKTLDQMLKLNLWSGFAVSRAAVPAMLKQGRGVIVNIASRAAVDHAAGASAYVASKAAAVAMMDSLAAELNGTGVRVNSVLPSIIDTAANRSAMPKADFSQWPKPQEIARVILFLCTGEAKLIHGASVPVYGKV